MFSDLRYAVRRLCHSVGFTSAAVLTLGLGIGANIAVYSVLQAVWFDALLFPDAGRLAILRSASERASDMPVSLRDFRDWRAENTAFAGIAALEYGDSMRLQTSSGEASVQSMKITAEMFAVLGVPPALGRTFSDEEMLPGAASRVAVISHEFWQQHFNGDPSAIGRVIGLHDGSLTVVGVAPPGFRIDRSAPSLWVPFTPPLKPHANQRGARTSAVVIGRLRPGVSLDQGREQMSAIAARLAQAYPTTNKMLTRVTVTSMRERAVGTGIEDSLFLLLGATAIVLLIACANIASLSLSRSTARRQEMAVRVALGARRSRLVRLVLAESGIVAAAGCALALLLTWLTRDALVASIALTVPGTADIGIDRRVLGVATLLAAATAVVTGLIPALRSSFVHPSRALGDVTPSATLGRRRLTSRGLIVAQAALSVVVVAVASVLLGTFVKLATTDPGFDPHNVITFRVQPAGNQSPDAVVERVLTELGHVPGVASAAGSDSPPLSGTWSTFLVTIPGRPARAPEDPLSMHGRKVTPKYFSTLGIPIVEGRDFGETDRLGAPRVAILNQTAAKQLWPGESPVSRQITVGLTTATIVGVSGDVRHLNLANAATPEVYLPHSQHPKFLAFLVKTDEAGMNVVPALKQRIEAGATVRMSDVRTLDEDVWRSIHLPRFRAQLFGLLALLVVGLTTIGVFGVTAYEVAQRRREIGIRLALGASARQILRLMIGQVASPVALGVIVGAVAALDANRLVAHFLYRTAPGDPLTLVLAMGTVVCAALVASYAAARRALRMSPATVLKE